MFQSITGLSTKLVTTAITLLRIASPAMAVTVGLLYTASPVGAQVAPVDPIPEPAPQMCGDGTTFTVELPAVSNEVPASSIELPRGCSIYALFVSDYGRNHSLDELTFYPLARFVAERNGYVHWSWWNNLLQPYMGGPVHEPTSSGRPHHPGPIPRLGLTRKLVDGALELIGLDDFNGTPDEPEIFFTSVLQSLKIKVSKVQLGVLLSLLAFKGADVRAGGIYEPNDDQFRGDARQWLFRVREENPTARIFVVGHGFGAHALAKVVKSASGTPIDLVGLIDPVGNTTTPTSARHLNSVFPGYLFPGISRFLDEILGPARLPKTEPDSRWRGTREFLGYRQNDCIRGNNGLCRDFDDRWWVYERRCRPDGIIADTLSGWLDTPPLIGSFRPLLCPGPVVHDPRALSIGTNVRILYHRWQHEIGPPSDIVNAYRFTRAGEPSLYLGDNNIQVPVHELNYVFWPGLPLGNGPVAGGSVCHSADFGCSSMDGHDELVGFQAIPVTGLGADLLVERGRDGVKARQWTNDETDMRAALAELGAGVSAFSAAIGYGRDGAPNYQPEVDPWPHAPRTFDDEGFVEASANLCRVCDDLLYLAHRIVGDDEAPEADTSAPTTEATTETPANEGGWHKGAVMVNLAASDQGGAGIKEIEHEASGAQAGGTTITPGEVAERLIDTDGVTTVTYRARDNATPSNEEQAKTFPVKLDTTAPVVTGAVSPPPNDFGWHNENVTVSFEATDATSGVENVTVTFGGDETSIFAGPLFPIEGFVVESHGAGQEIEGTAIDAAGNAGGYGAVLNIDKTNPELSGAADRLPDRNGWFNRPLTITWSCLDATSGTQSWSDPSDYLGPDTSATAISGECLDRADNRETASVEFRYDATAPTSTAATPDQSPNAKGWLRAAVAVRLAATDLGSGVQEIERSLSGAQSIGPSISPGGEADQLIDTDGISTLTYFARDIAGNDEDPKTFVVRLDRGSPTVSAAVAPPANDFGWHNTDVTVTFSATDATSEAAMTSPAVVVVGSEGEQRIEGTAVDDAGNEGRHAVVLNIDKTAPKLTGTTDRGANGNGWFNRPVTIHWSCTDEVSKVQSTSDPSEYSGPDTASKSIAGSCSDHAGHSVTAEVALRFDATAPVIGADVVPTANAFGWHNTDVTVTFSATDAPSGVAMTSPAAPHVVTAEGAKQQVDGSAVDNADNTATHPVVLNIDKTRPILTGNFARNPDSSGWYNHAFSITWSCKDTLSLVESSSEASSYTGPDIATGALEGWCVDRADNSTTTSMAFRYDATVPGVTIASPAATVYVLNASTTAAYTCADNLSGVASCIGSVPSGALIDTSSVGVKTFAATAHDVAGNSAALANSYSVRYAYQGPFSPIEAMPQVNVARAGRTIPFKYRLSDANGVTITDLGSFVSLQSVPVACDATATENVLEEEADVTAAGLRFDAASNQFIVNWQTSSSWTGCRLLQLGLNDGSEHTTLFNFR